MLIVKPKVELWEQGDDIVHHIARCARICYDSEGNNKGDIALFNNLLKKNHHSMFRHWVHYFVVPENTYNNYYETFEKAFISPYVKHKKVHNVYIALNHNYFLDNEDTEFINVIREYECNTEEFNSFQEGFDIMSHTFFVRTQISNSRELNRVSPNSIAERSTRYVNYNKNREVTVCLPHWWSFDGNEMQYKYDYNTHTHYAKVDNEEWHPFVNTLIHLATPEYYGYMAEAWCMNNFANSLNYNKMVENGMKPQDARGFLPLDTVTECIYTYSIEEWRHILDLRYYGTTSIPHPNAQYITSLIREELIKLGYDFKD